MPGQDEEPKGVGLVDMFKPPTAEEKYAIENAEPPDTENTGVGDHAAAAKHEHSAASSGSSGHHGEMGDDMEIVVDRRASEMPAAAELFGGKDRGAAMGVEVGDAEAGLGTLSGVYIPCLQNILGVILFLRLSWIVGNAGIGLSLVIVVLCVGCTTLTTLSLNAVATNGRIRGGGAYYLISRNLGPQVGCAVGILFTLATTAGATMYILGVVEAWNSTWPSAVIPGSEAVNIRVQALILLFLLAFMVKTGLKTVAKIAPFFLVPVMVGIVSVLVGTFTLGTGAAQVNEQEAPGLSNSQFSNNFGPSFTGGHNLFSMVAIFFPSVTGIMAGSNKSAALADPGRSIPIGTLGAIASTTLLYIIWILMFGAVAVRQTLIDELFLVPKVSWPASIIVELSIMLSSSGAALQALSGAPQLLAGIAKDFHEEIPMFRRVLADEDGAATNALYMLTCVCAALCMLGDIDSIAPVTTMFFLLFYACVNVACLVPTLLERPSWRPTWPYFNAATATAGAMLCLGLMFAIEWISALVAILLTAGLYKYVEYKGVERDWGDGLTGLKYQQVVNGLKELGEAEHVTNWRPQFLLMYRFDPRHVTDVSVLRRTATEVVRTEAENNAPYDDGALGVHTLQAPPDGIQDGLFNILSYFRRSGGIFQTVGLYDSAMAKQEVESEASGSESDDDETAARKAEHERNSFDVRQKEAIIAEDLKKELAAYVKALKLPAFFKIIFSALSEHAVSMILQTVGVGPLQPNLVMLAFPRQWTHAKVQRRFFLETLDACERQEKGVVVAMKPEGFVASIDPKTKLPKPYNTTVDVWWERSDGGMMLILARLLMRHKLFRRCKLRLLTLSFANESSQSIERTLKRYLESVRIDAEVVVVDTEAPFISHAVVQKTLDFEAAHDLAQELRAYLKGGSSPQREDSVTSASPRSRRSKNNSFEMDPVAAMAIDASDRANASGKSLEDEIIGASKLQQQRVKTLRQQEEEESEVSPSNAFSVTVDAPSKDSGSGKAASSGSGSGYDVDRTLRGQDGEALNLQQLAAQLGRMRLLADVNAAKDVTASQGPFAARADVEDDSKQENDTSGGGLMNIFQQPDAEQNASADNSNGDGASSRRKGVSFGAEAGPSPSAGGPRKEKSSSLKKQKSSTLAVPGTEAKTRTAETTPEKTKKLVSSVQENKLDKQRTRHQKRLKIMATAMRYNERFLRFSKDAAVVITNLPSVGNYTNGEEFLAFTQELCSGLDRVLLIRGTNKEVVSSLV